jgi:hypothetical protein
MTTDHTADDYADDGDLLPSLEFYRKVQSEAYDDAHDDKSGEPHNRVY